MKLVEACGELQGRLVSKQSSSSNIMAYVHETEVQELQNISIAWPYFSNSLMAEVFKQKIVNSKTANLYS